ncbi:MAG: M48 family peptidase [Methanobacteriota archaeon]|nr:MAG: M48 family peptidase [Euryarchaeota archaeon]
MEDATETSYDFNGADVPYLKLDELDEKTQLKSKRYHDSKLQLQISSMLYGPFVLLVLWVVGVPELFAKITGTEFSFFSAYLMFALITITSTVLSFPFDLAGNVLERRYGFSTQTWGQWLIDQLKNLLIQLILLGGLITLVYSVIDRFPLLWWIYAFLVAFVFLSFIQFIAPVILIPLFMKMESFPEGELRTRIEKLAQTMGIKYKDIYLLQMSQQTTKANAMVTGFGSTIRIVLGDTLVKNFRPDEIEIVMAHEIAHQKNRDVYRMIVFLGFLLLVAFFLIDLGFQWVIDWFDYNGKSDLRTMFYFAFSLEFWTMLFLPIQNFFSRSREKAADIAAIQQIPNLKVYESAFTRLALQNLSYLHPSRLEVLLFYSHPPIRERVKYAQTFLNKINS